MPAEALQPVALPSPIPPVLIWDRSGGHAGLEVAGRPFSLKASAALCLWTTGFVANRDDLRRLLSVTGPACDSELLLLLVERLGFEEAAKRIAGPFSWAIWEPRAGRLVVVRDRQGAHPLYLAERGATVALGDVDHVLGSRPAVAELDVHAVAGHLTGPGPPPGRSFFRGVVAIEPGELVLVSSDAVVRRRYWRLEPPSLSRLGSDESYAERLRELLAEVVAGYVPAGAAGVTLSGGMDSTTVAAMLAQQMPERPAVAVPWIAPELPEADESPLSRAVARHLGMPLAEVRADLCWPLSTGLPAGTPDGPELTAYPDLWQATLRTAREKGVDALFTGASGDNLFGGVVSTYPDFLLTLRWVRLLRELREHLPHSRIGLAGITRRLIVGPIRHTWFGAGPLPPSWLTLRARRAAQEIRNGLPAPPRLALPGRRLQLAQLFERLPALVGAQLGRHAADHGIELRQPLLDHRLVEFAAALPPDQLFRAGRWKHVLRNAMRDRLPPEVLALRHKIVPLPIFRRGLWERERERVGALFRDMRAADLGLVEPAALRDGYERYFARRGGDGRFWQALTLESWLRARR